MKGNFELETQNHGYCNINTIDVGTSNTISTKQSAEMWYNASICGEFSLLFSKNNTTLIFSLSHKIQ